MLADLLQVVTWQQALARACADLLEGLGRPVPHRRGR